MARKPPSASAEYIGPPALRTPGWHSIEGLRHGFYGRAGGHSRGTFASLNLSYKVGDDEGAVDRNWQDLRRSLEGQAIVRVEQVHGLRILRIDSPPEQGSATAGKADGLISNTAGVAVAVSTADCVPVLMVASKQRTVMAIHAGWRGTVGGIVAAALETAEREFAIPAVDWQAALGPSIDGCCYEVTRDIGNRLENTWGAMPNAWEPAQSKGLLHLRRANREILIRHGVPRDAIVFVGPCTSCNDSEYFSHRSSNGTAGRQISLIGYDDDSVNP